MLIIVFFLACAFGGILACGPTHVLLTPLDLIKCRRQVDEDVKGSFFAAVRDVYRREGISGLYCGWLPTGIGYSALGFFKFGLYETTKRLCLMNGIWILALAIPASAGAEIIADVALCPWEAIKVTMQTSSFYDRQSTWRTGRGIMAREGYRGFFQGLYPLWCRQVPYTIFKFFTFEAMIEFIYNLLGAPKQQYTGFHQTMIALAAGFITGLGCAIVSNPADVLVSELNYDRRVGESLYRALRRTCYQIGFKGIWKGLSIRLMMVGTLTAIQWFVYDGWKVVAGISATGND